MIVALKEAESAIQDSSNHTDQVVKEMLETDANTITCI